MKVKDSQIYVFIHKSRIVKNQHMHFHINKCLHNLKKSTSEIKEKQIIERTKKLFIVSIFSIFFYGKIIENINIMYEIVQFICRH